MDKINNKQQAAGSVLLTQAKDKQSYLKKKKTDVDSWAWGDGI